ncbi:MAG: DNA starvation/stationary phase protection protein [Firmicutes bacterium]|nr:DNA starvation/stationary phase protection protein [Bacillota bacterium]MCL1953128.1 DNA starvation/stationary phase protection protein [Bacillota bacterium]
MKLNEKMNIYLANQHIMFVKLHNLHWYVKGSKFFTLHAKFEELYDATAKVLDSVAERLLMIGGKPVASLAGALKLATIKELDDKDIQCEDSLNVVLADIQLLATQANEIVKLAEQDGDQGTADMFLDYVGEYQKLIWMLKATLNK